MPPDVSYPHTKAEEYTPSSSTTTVSISSSSMDPNIINCADGGCPEGTADSITDLSPEDQDAVKDALEIDPESVNRVPFIYFEENFRRIHG